MTKRSHDQAKGAGWSFAEHPGVSGCALTTTRHEDLVRCAGDSWRRQAKGQS
jgi:hypothetical protein